MTTRRILVYPDARLRQRTKAVLDFDHTLESVVEDLADTLYSTTGVGLAAPQIGSELSVFIYDPFRNHEQSNRTYSVLVNPRVRRNKGQTTSFSEGCKSAPHLRVDVPRAAKLTVDGFDRAGEPVRLQADGYLAIVLQHEIDHLNGVLLTDQLQPEELAAYTAGKWRNRPGPNGMDGRVAKVGRNDPCPCGSDLKFKKCHGRV